MQLTKSENVAKKNRDFVMTLAQNGHCVCAWKSMELEVHAFKACHSFLSALDVRMTFLFVLFFFTIASAVMLWHEGCSRDKTQIFFNCKLVQPTSVGLALASHSFGVVILIAKRLINWFSVLRTGASSPSRKLVYEFTVNKPPHISWRCAANVDDERTPLSILIGKIINKRYYP